MRKRKIFFYQTECKFCKCALTTASRSIYGCDALKEKYGSICGDCMTPEVKHKMLDEIASGILNGERQKC